MLDDDDLFREAMGDVTPLKASSQIHWLPVAHAKGKAMQHADSALDNFLTRDFLDIIPLDTPLEFKAEGIQLGVLNKLRQGKYALDASLNLTRQPVEQCRLSLFSFITQATQQNLRNLLIIHGKGRADDSHANIVRSYVARWLQQFEQVQAYCLAQTQDGGSGACYVALRKNAAAREENGERHAKRSR